MSKVSYNNASDLSTMVSKKMKALNKGKLTLSELDELVKDAQQLYEELVVLRYQAFNHLEKPKTAVREATIAEAVPEEHTAFDFTGITEEKKETSQEEEIGFDFTIDEPIAQEEISFEPVPETVSETTLSQTPEKNEDVKEIPEVKTSKISASNTDEQEDQLPHEIEDNSLYNRFKSEDDDSSLRKKLQNSPIADIKEHISIAKKFEYISQMFSGDTDAYNEAIDFLNNCAKKSDAKQKIDAYPSEYQWDLENKSIQKFIELIDRRYPD